MNYINTVIVVSPSQGVPNRLLKREQVVQKITQYGLVNA